MNRMKFFFVAMACVALARWEYGTGFAADHVALQLKWSHQSQFAGFYVAKEQGFYDRENLDVDLLPGGPKVDQMQAVAEGRAEFTVLSPDYILIERSRGVSIKAIAAIYRRSAVVYASMPESGIVRPRDFLGKNRGLRRKIRQYRGLSIPTGGHDEKPGPGYVPSEPRAV